jgi:hypothetical protein
VTSAASAASPVGIEITARSTRDLASAEDPAGHHRPDLQHYPFREKAVLNPVNNSKKPSLLVGNDKVRRVIADGSKTQLTPLDNSK